MTDSIATSLDERFGEQPRTFAAGSGAFAHYELDPGIHDEMFHRDGRPREACRRLGAALARASPDDLASLQDGVVNSSQGGGCKDLWILRGEEGGAR